MLLASVHLCTARHLTRKVENRCHHRRYNNNQPGLYCSTSTSSVSLLVCHPNSAWHFFDTLFVKFHLYIDCITSPLPSTQVPHEKSCYVWKMFVPFSLTLLAAYSIIMSMKLPASSLSFPYASRHTKVIACQCLFAAFVDITPAREGAPVPSYKTPMFDAPCVCCYASCSSSPSYRQRPPDTSQVTTSFGRSPRRGFGRDLLVKSL